jgi:hypothetical protein
MKLSLCASAALLLVFAGSAMAEGLEATSVPETRRAVVSEFDDGSDRPCSPVKVVIPAAEVAGVSAVAGTQIAPGSDVVAAPAVETLPAPPTEVAQEKATFGGHEIGGRIVWCIDRSGSMGVQDTSNLSVEDHNGNTILSPTRLQVVKADVARALVNLEDTDQYAIVFFGGYPQTSANQTLVTANEAGIQQGLQRLNMAHSGYNTPTQLGLNLAMTQYGSNISRLFFMTDGLPTVGPGAESILSWFPGAFAPLAGNDCQFHATHVGDNHQAEQFVRGLANSVNGDFLKR